MPDLIQLEVNLDENVLRLKAAEIVETIDDPGYTLDEDRLDAIVELLRAIYMEAADFGGQLSKMLDGMNRDATDSDRYRTALNEIIDGARDPISVAWKARWPEAGEPTRPVFGPANPDTGEIGGMDFGGMD